MLDHLSITNRDPISIYHIPLFCYYIGRTWNCQKSCVGVVWSISHEGRNSDYSKSTIVKQHVAIRYLGRHTS